MTDFYIRVPNDLSDYTCDQTIISKKKYLKHLSRVKYEDDCICPLPQIIDWYPFTNSYYPYTEDVDAVARVNHLLGSKPSFESLTSIPNCDGFYDEDSYSERGAQLQYLSANPISFLILGKPGIGEQELGKLLADYWQCVYIDPETLIREEINYGSRAGQCIEFNLRSGRAIGVDIILRLVEKRVKSKSAQHRGFVICGFPMIPNDLYQEDPVSSESAVFNVQEIFEDLFETTIDIGVPPEIPNVSKASKREEVPGEEEADAAISEAPPSGKTVKLPENQDDIPLDIGSATSNICGPGDYERNFEDQINFIFNQFHRPFIVIYVMCSNSDVLSKHKDYRFDFFSNQVVDLQREHSDKVVYTFFSRVPGATSDEIPDDFIDVVKNTTIAYDSSRPRQLLKLPRDFPSNMVALLDRYRYFALPVIERHILVHDCQYFIKVDGRISPVRMFSAVKTRLRVLPLQRVILPEKCLAASEPGGEGGPADDADFEGLTLDECFQLFRKNHIASTMFKWGWSDWGVKCPVSMREGDYKDGDPKFAVHFMNKIFFLSDENAYLKFYRNPRPYLLPPYPKPSGKIFVVGPRCSGKSAVAKCLGYFLKTEVLDFDIMKREFITLKRIQYEEKVRSAALNEGIAVLNQMRRLEWETKENERQMQVEAWLRQQQALLEETIKLKEFLAEDEDQISLVVEISSFPMQLSYHRKSRALTLLGSDTSIASADYMAKIKKTIAELEELININGLPGLGDIALCEQLLGDSDKLLDYLPPLLRPPEVYDVVPATAFDDFVKQYVENAVKNMTYEDIELTPEQTADMLAEAIKGVEERSLQQGNNKGGWIVDGLPIHDDLFERILSDFIPDDMFILKDTGEHEFLLQRFETKGQNEFRDFRRFFMDIGKPDAAWRSPSLRSTASYKSLIVGDILGDVVDESLFIAERKAAEESPNQEEKDPYFKKHPRRQAVEAYKKDLNKFDGDLDNLYDILNAHKISVTEIAVTNKSFDTLLKEIINNVENRFRQLASVFTEEDKLQEQEDFGEPEMQGEELGEGEEKAETEDLFSQNRRFGDTFNYCPVTFHNHWVLWRGKEEYAAKFENKLYFMCNEDALNAFIYDPRRYLLQTRPPSPFPPPRLCIVGPRGSGKTTVTKVLCKNLGLYSASYDKLIKNAIAPKSKFELSEILNMGIAAAQGVMIENYFATDEPLPEDFLNKVILPLWSDDPVKLFGFVFDSFPRRPSDTEYMTEHAAIPDIVVELSITEGEIQRRLLEKFINDWQKALSEKQEILGKRHREIIDVWEEKRNTRFKELMEIRKEERYIAKIQEKNQGTEAGEDVPKRPYLEDVLEAEEETEPSTVRTTKSLISYDSVAEEADIEAVNLMLEQEMPEIVFEEEPEESLENAIERYVNELHESYSTEVGFLRITRERCETQLIPWITVDAGMIEDKVLAQVMRVVDKYKFRNDSLFERVYDISVDLADKLLSNGYYFLSKFGKTCPVQIYENINPIQMFLPLEQKFQLFPVIHRHYIYFLAGLANRNKFKEDPLKYTSQKDCNFPLIPFKLAIIGPPKSGKTALAERFHRDLGMKVISRGQAGRYVLKFLEFSELARNMESVLRCGWDLTCEMAMKTVAAVTFDGKSIAQGFVLDGFPGCIEEVRHLAQLGLVPHLVIDLQAEHADIYEFLASDKGKRGLPVYSEKFFDHRYYEWLETAKEFWEWLDKEYQIIAKIPVKPSKWGVWTASYELATAVFSEVKHYYKYARDDMALRLANMQVTPLEFIERQGAYKNYCPCCLHYDNALVNGGDPPDRTGLVQFRKYYYYLCYDHIDEFIADPEQFLSPYNNHNLPPNLPKRVFLSQTPKDAYQEGVCIICYWENQPRRVTRKGTAKYTLMYKEKVYLFDSLNCMNKFMKHPHKFYAKTINFKGKPYPSLKYHQLPTLGLLQQYDAKQLIKAIINTADLRPIVPGLSPSISACLNVGLYLKVHNPRTPEEFLPLYEAALARRVPVPDERYDYLCNYFKPVSKVPAFLNIVDIAGLVKGASEGQGLGNAFLSHISACDAIFHLLRAFEDTDVTHVEGEVDPVRDLDIILEELRLKDEEQLMKNLEKVERNVVRGGDKKQKPEYDTLAKVKTVLVDQKQHIRFADWSVIDIEVLNRYLFLTSKPMIYLVNLAEKDYIKKKNKWLVKIKEWVDKNDPGATIIPFSGMFEHKLTEIEDPILSQKYLEENNVHSALDKIILQGYKALQLEYFFTAGADEVKAWTIQKGTKAPQAAGKIHTDFEKGFIMAEVMKFVDFKEEGSESAAKAAGKYRQQGRNYVVEDGDIIFFKFNAGAGLKEAKKK